MPFNYKPAKDTYSLVVELHEPQDGVKRFEISPYGVDPIN